MSNSVRMLGTIASVAALAFAASAFAASAAAAPAAHHRAGSKQDLVFRGNGGKTIAPFTISRASTLRWSASGGIFQIFPKGFGDGSVNSQAAAGATYMRASRYTLTVNAIGAWTIRIAAGVERPQRMGDGYVGFKGNGGRTLPPLSARRSGHLYWRASGGIFQIFPDGFDGPSVNSQGARGSTYMERGTHLLTVNALGSWTIYWRL